MLSCLRLSCPVPVIRSFCTFYNGGDSIDMAKYKEVFSRRMAMAGLKPHHRIALGVSGGPDSMALCVLTSGWKADALIGTDETAGSIDGLLAIIVDHGLRDESKDEANSVGERVSRMGIRSEIVRCDWPNGRPKQGHLQEAARDMRYRIFENVCIKYQIGVLLIAHHADDQAELLIIRLSRNSGVLGLAGMAFTSELFPTYTYYRRETSSNHGILLVRPLLEFTKEDMYKICQGANWDWVEDPTNQSPLFARNRIRMALKNVPSCIFKSELQTFISACRKTRSFVDQICYNLIKKAVTIMPHGYAIIDLEKLDPSNVKDIYLSKFVALVLQFISQRHRPVRGSTSKLVLDYIRIFPCKTSLTAAGCYLCAAPRSKGTKVLVCCSPDGLQPSNMELSQQYFHEGPHSNMISEVDQIIMDGKSYSNHLLPDATDVHFLDVKSSESILMEAKRQNILSESTYRNILLLQSEEAKQFKSKKDVISEIELKHEVKSICFSKELPLPGQSCQFMNRFLITWKLSRQSTAYKFYSEDTICYCSLEWESQEYLCSSCVVGHDTVVEVHHMVDTDWMYLATLVNSQITEKCESAKLSSASKMDHRADKTNLCSDYVRLSAEGALRALKSIPASVRRGLPVLVNPEGLLLSIPSICFKHCPYLKVSAVYNPRVPLGGGHASFI